MPLSLRCKLKLLGRVQELRVGALRESLSRQSVPFSCVVPCVILLCFGEAKTISAFDRSDSEYDVPFVCRLAGKLACRSHFLFWFCRSAKHQTELYFGRSDCVMTMLLLCVAYVVGE